MSEDLKVGLIGAGQWGKKIIHTLNAMPGVQLTHIAKRTQHIEEGMPSSCSVSTNWRHLVSSFELDGVIIATPAGLHSEMSAYALKHKIPVFVEKPMAMTVVEAQLLCDLVEEYSGILQVDYIDIDNPAWQALKSQLSMVGNIKSIEAIFGGAGPIRKDVTTLWDWGSHPIALILSLLNEPDNISAKKTYMEQTEDGDLEEVNISLDYRSIKTKISISNHYAESIRNLSIHGTKGTLVYDDKNDNKLIFIKDEKVKVLNYSNMSPLRSALDRFIMSIVKGSPEYKDIYLGLMVTKTLSKIDSILSEKSMSH